MYQLSKKKRHDLITKVFPDAVTCYDPQYKFAFIADLNKGSLVQQFIATHRDLELIDKELHDAFKRNVERKSNY